MRQCVKIHEIEGVYSTNMFSESPFYKRFYTNVSQALDNISFGEKDN